MISRLSSSSLLFISLLVLTLSMAQAQTRLSFLGQQISPDDEILSAYYAELPYSFLTVRNDLRSDDPTKKAILIKLFFNSEVHIKKVEVLSSDATNMSHPIDDIHLFDTSAPCRKEARDKKNTLYFDKVAKELDIHVHPDPDVKDIKLKVSAYGLNRQGIFQITRHLLSTRADSRQNEALLRRLYEEGHTTILTLLKYEEYPRLYLPRHSLFNLPDDADFARPLKETLSHLKNGEYFSQNGLSALPKDEHKSDYLLFVDKEKIRFLKNVDPQKSIVIKKIDLAQ